MAETDAHKSSLLPGWFNQLGGVERALLVLTVLGFGFTLVDPAIHELARKLDPHTRSIFQVITDVGKSGWILWPTGLALIVLAALRTRDLSRRVRVAFDYWIGVLGFIFIAVAGSGLLTQLLKGIIGRARPKFYEDLGPLGFDPFAFTSTYASFPSGHTTTIFALATAIALMVPRMRVFAFIVAVWVGASRFFVGAHYFTDVIGGVVVGIGFTLWLARSFAARRNVFDLREGKLQLRGRRLTRWLWNTALGKAQERLPASEPEQPADDQFGVADTPQPEGSSVRRRLPGFGRGWRLWPRT